MNTIYKNRSSFDVRIRIFYYREIRKFEYKKNKVANTDNRIRNDFENRIAFSKFLLSSYRSSSIILIESDCLYTYRFFFLNVVKIKKKKNDKNRHSIFERKENESSIRKKDFDRGTKTISRHSTRSAPRQIS